MIGRSERVAPPIVALVAALALLAAACGSAPATPNRGGSVTGTPPSQAATAASSPSPLPPASTAPPPSAVSTTTVQVDPGLLDFVPSAVDGVSLTFDPVTSATIAVDPSVEHDVASLAVALAVVAGASAAADDLAIISVVRLRDPARDEAWFRDWRDSYDEAACGQAGGLVGNAEAEIGGATVFIGSCSGGALTYHTRLVEAGIVVSLTALGGRKLGEKVMAGLHR